MKFETYFREQYGAALDSFSKQDIQSTIFHNTTPDRVEKIRQKGIYPLSVLHYSKGGVYFWRNYEKAVMYAGMSNLGFEKKNVIIHIDSRKIDGLYNVEEIPEAVWTPNTVPPDAIIKIEYYDN